MDFWLNHEQKVLRYSIREFSENEITPMAQDLDDSEVFSDDIIQKMGNLGLFGIFVSEKYGGVGMDYLSYCIILEELSRVDTLGVVIIATPDVEVRLRSRCREPAVYPWRSYIPLCGRRSDSERMPARFAVRTPSGLCCGSKRDRTERPALILSGRR